MPEGGSKLRTANRTSLRRRTGRSGAGDMTLCRRNDGAAHRTNLVFRTRRIGAERMTVRGNGLRPFLITAAARRSLYAFFRAGRSFRLNIFTPIMPESRDDFLRLEDGVTARAMIAFGFPRSRTRCRYRLVDDLDMPESIDIPRLRFPAPRTFRHPDAFLRPGRGFRLNIFAPIMPESRNFFLRFDDGITAGAMDAFGFPRRRTRCRNSLIDDFCMAESFGIPRLRFPAARTFGCLNAFLRTSRRFRLRVCTPIMPESGNFLLCLDDRITTGTMRTVRQTRLHTCRGNGGIDHGSMT